MDVRMVVFAPCKSHERFSNKSARRGKRTGESELSPSRPEPRRNGENYGRTVNAQ